MKNYILLIPFLILGGCLSETPEWSHVEISGVMENKKIESISFYPVETLVDDYNNLYNISIEENGSSKFDYPLRRPTTAILFVDDFKFLIYLEPGSNIAFRISQSNLLKFTEENQKNNTIYWDYQQQFNPYFESGLNYKLDSDQFVHQVDSISNEKLLFLASNKKNISQSLFDFLTEDINYYAAKEKIYFARRYANELIKEENNFFAFIEPLKKQKWPASFGINHLDYIDNYINFLYLNKIWGPGAEYKNDFIEKYYIALAELRDEPLELFLTENLKIGMGVNSEKEKFNEVLNEFLSGNYSERSKNIIKQGLSDLSDSSIAEGKIAPDFSLGNAKNKQFKLSDFNQQYIVIDFWASWCAPCRKEMPQMIKMAADYQDIAQFVFISIDGNRLNWEKANSQLGIPEPSLIMDSLTRHNYEFARTESIPFYLVLDQNKRVILRNANKEQIKSLLTK